MSLSNYPPGFSGGVDSSDDVVPHTCPTCGKKWTARMFYELGGWFYADDNEATCSDCDNGEEAILDQKGDK